MINISSNSRQSLILIFLIASQNSGWWWTFKRYVLGKRAEVLRLIRWNKKYFQLQKYFHLPLNLIIKSWGWEWCGSFHLFPELLSLAPTPAMLETEGKQERTFTWEPITFFQIISCSFCTIWISSVFKSPERYRGMGLEWIVNTLWCKAELC